MSIATLPTLVFAQWHGAVVPDSLSFQGAVDSAGIPLNKTVPMTFKLYKNGTNVWTEMQPSVEVVDGVFNVMLGSVTPLDTVAFGEMIELGVAVDDDPEIVPRTPLAASAFALGMRGMHAVWATTLGASSESFNIIGGAPNNSMASGVIGGTIGGGGGKQSNNPRPNSVEASWATIGGGGQNTASGFFATIGGGVGNTASGNNATIGGGVGNTASGNNPTIGGGNSNMASSNTATVAGGASNIASGITATVGGGIGNSAEGNSSIVPGGENNRARGGYSFAAGQRAKADHDGAFVWADSVGGGADFVSTGINQFLIRAGGGVGINTNAPAHPLHVGTDTTNGNGAHVTKNGVWTSASSRSFKDRFEEIDKTELLHRLAALPVTKWHYRGDGDVSHIGPVAEDFREAFGLGHDDRYITTVDADGVALAAIQGLYELVVAQQAEIEALRERIERRAD